MRDNIVHTSIKTTSKTTYLIINLQCSPLRTLKEGVSEMMEVTG